MHLVHLIDWPKIPQNEWDSQLAELAEAGVRELVLSSDVGDALIDRHEDKLFAFAGHMEKAGMRFTAAHALWWAMNDLNWPDEAGRKRMVRAQGEWMKTAAGLGVKTFTIHPGVRWFRYSEKVLWNKIRHSLDGLLPSAEDCKMILALENNLQHNIGDVAAELANVVAEYASPCLGLCFDSGHANVMEGVMPVLDTFSSRLVTCHLHDNDGSRDAHQPPGNGSIDWPKLIDGLSKCPRLIHCETEAHPSNGQTSVQNAMLYEKLFKLNAI